MINIQNFGDNQSFKWCLIKHSDSVDYHPARNRKVDRKFESKLHFKEINFPFNIRDIHKIGKKNVFGISVFDYENKEKYPLHA